MNLTYGPLDHHLLNYLIGSLWSDLSKQILLWFDFNKARFLLEIQPELNNETPQERV